MGGTRDDELSSSMAILGLLIERPDTAGGLERRLAERFAADGFVHSTGHSALRRLAATGYVRTGVEGRPEGRVRRAGAVGPERAGHDQAKRDRAQERFVVTPEGVTAFQRWLGTASATPLIREDLRGKIAFLAPSDLPRMIDILRAEEDMCAAEYESVHARMGEIELGVEGAPAGSFDLARGRPPERSADLSQGRAPEGPFDLAQWRARMRLLLLRDEATVWMTRRQRLERMRAYLEDLFEEFRGARPGRSAPFGR
ncbi:MAG TPA: hypothetical protein VID29_03340 [Solirubrobacteraceae bacterium]|jgi:hypothetical protein